MFTTTFWVAFGIAVLISLGIATAYGRRAIHPRLRPHFGWVVIVFLFLVLASFALAIVVSHLIGQPLPTSNGSAKPRPHAVKPAEPVAPVESHPATPPDSPPDHPVDPPANPAADPPVDPPLDVPADPAPDPPSDPAADP